MGFGEAPCCRLGAFLDQEFVISPTANRCPGSCADRAGGAVRRDDITGEPLPRRANRRPSSTPPSCWPLAASPRRLEFLGLPAGASVGFVVYHEGIAVNDFRYMAASQALNLDWNDPWYSAFDQPRAAAPVLRTDERLHLRGALRGPQGDHRPAQRSAALRGSRADGPRDHPGGDAGRGAAKVIEFLSEHHP